ncbi:hypothetical protein [Hydrogenophaga sp.]|uniref:hypothetical protein n=1 Tax=Hydrogenophaga sp. TaxID=1904254 RepID=UPI003AF83E37
MEVLVFIALAVGVWWWFKKKAPSDSSATAKPSADPEIKLAVTISTSFAREEDAPPRDVGPLTETDSGAWVLNPLSPFPLTLRGADRALAQKVKDVLGTHTQWTQKVPELALLIAKHNLRFKEVDDLALQLRPKYDAHIQRRITASPDWGAASEKDRADLLTEFQEEALESLGLSVGQADLATLLTGPPTMFQADDELLHRFDKDLDLYPFYLTQLGRANAVVTVKADDWGRKAWERLADMGMALRGRDIPREKLLEGLRLKDLNEVLEGVFAKPLGRKAKAIEALLAQPDLDARLDKKVSFREMFQAIAPADVDLTDLQASFGHASEVARVVQQTYFTGVKTLDEIDERKRERGIYDAWEIRNWEDPLPACAKAFCKKYDRLPTKRPPFHLGCNCQLESAFKDD